MSDDMVSEIIEGVIGLVMIIGGLAVIILNQTLAGVIVPLMVLVLVAYFGQRASKSATNGTIKAMSNIAKSTQDAAAVTAEHTVSAAATMTRLGPEVVPAPPAPAPTEPTLPAEEEQNAPPVPPRSNT